MRHGSRPPDGGQEEGKERAQKKGSHGLLEVLLLVLVGKRRGVAHYIYYSIADNDKKLKNIREFKLECCVSVI